MRVVRESDTELVLVRWYGSSFGHSLALRSGLPLLLAALAVVAIGVATGHDTTRSAGIVAALLVPEMLMFTKVRETWRFYRGQRTETERPFPYLFATRTSTAMTDRVVSRAPNPRWLDISHAGRREHSFGFASEAEATRVLAWLEHALTRAS